jgi:hypothetical protein
MGVTALGTAEVVECVVLPAWGLGVFGALLEGWADRVGGAAEEVVSGELEQATQSVRKAADNTIIGLAERSAEFTKVLLFSGIGVSLAVSSVCLGKLGPGSPRSSAGGVRLLGRSGLRPLGCLARYWRRKPKNTRIQGN